MDLLLLIIVSILFFLLSNIVFIIWALVLAKRYLQEHPSKLYDEQDFILKRMWRNIEIKHGVKAGILTEVIAGTMFLIIWYFFILTYIFDEHFFEHSEFLFYSIYLMYYSTINVILGFFLGAIYAILYTRLPSESPTTKGMALGAIYTLYLIIINSLLFGYPRYISFKKQLIFHLYIILFYILIFGILIGMFWSYLKQKEESIEKELKGISFTK